MGSRVCYLARTDRGGRIGSVRLVGERTDESWTPPPPGEGGADGASAEAVIAQARGAAEWVAERLAAADPPLNELALLCLDSEGAACAWLTAPTAEPSVVAAAVTQRGGLVSESGEIISGWSTVQALSAPLAPESKRAGLSRSRKARKAAPEAGVGERLAVIDVPDVPARHFIDALDDLGVGVRGAVSLWHAAARAWDPAGPVAARLGGEASGGTKRDDVVANVAGVSGTVVLDPAGRLVWAWSRAGELITGGTVRLAAEGQAAVRLDPADIGRLTADWLAWATQLGCAPARIICLGAGPGESGGLTPSGIGEALGRAWPGATVDLAVIDDPVGATLLRLAETAAGSAGVPTDAGARSSMVVLSHRPGRSHRSMYRWAAGLLLAGAGALGAIAWQAYRAADSAAAEAEASRELTEKAIVEALPEAANSPLGRRLLAAKVEELRRERGPVNGLDPTRPILGELDALSMVLGDPTIEIEDISLRPDIVLVTVLVPSGPEGTKLAEGLSVDLNRIQGSSCRWRGHPGGASRDADKQAWSLEGSWVTPEPSARRGVEPDGGSAS